MGEVELLKQEIEQKAAALSEKIFTLETHAREILSPVHHIEQHPLLWVGLFFGAGLIVGSQRNSSRRIIEPLAVSLFSAVAEEVGKKYLARQADAVTTAS